jgi:hypothetical protein
MIMPPMRANPMSFAQVATSKSSPNQLVRCVRMAVARSLWFEADEGASRNKRLTIDCSTTSVHGS